MTVLRIEHIRGQKPTMVECQCECGTIKRLQIENLQSGGTKSCGCLRQKQLSTHNYCYHPFYGRWKGMITRCYNKSHHRYKDYGGRGITVCDEWRDGPKAFCDWCDSIGADMRLELDRTDNMGNYSPENCRFVTRSQNQSNKRNTVWLNTPWGRLSISDTARKLGINHTSLRSRIYRYGKDDPRIYKCFGTTSGTI